MQAKTEPCLYSLTPQQGSESAESAAWFQGQKEGEHAGDGAPYGEYGAWHKAAKVWRGIHTDCLV